MVRVTGFESRLSHIDDPVVLTQTVRDEQSEVLSFASAHMETSAEHDGLWNAQHYSCSGEFDTTKLGPDRHLCFVKASVDQADSRVWGRQSFSSQNGVEIRLEIPSEPAGYGTILCWRQHAEWWMRPEWVTDFSSVPRNTQMIAWKSAEVWHVLLAASGHQCRADFKGGASKSELLLSMSTNRRGITQINDLAFGVAQGLDLSKCVSSLTRAIASYNGIETIDKRSFPVQLSGLGWCTWDSLGKGVAEKDIFRKMEDLSESGAHVSWVLIDDGWSQVDRTKETLMGWDADPKRFPHGLAHTVTVLKERYGVKHVGVWQAYQGYWNGIEPDSEVAREAAEFLEKLPDGTLVPGPAQSQSYGFWNKWHSYLAQAGVDFVKVDSQSSMAVFVREEETYGVTGKRHNGLDDSVEKNFDGALINCMGMSPEDYWHRPLSPLTRTSDDFVPRVENWLGEHALQNVFSSLVLGNLYYCDFDMFWTQHEDAQAHLLLRLLSGGPLYFSDAVGKTDVGMLAPALRENGEVPRCDTAAVPTSDCILKDFSGVRTTEKTTTNNVLKIRTKRGDVQLMAVLNLSSDPQKAPSDFSLSQKDFTYENSHDVWVYAWHDQQVMQVPAGESLGMDLSSRAVALYSAYTDSNRLAQSGIIVVGLASKYLSDAFVESVSEESGVVNVRMSELGTFALIDTDGRVESISTLDERGKESAVSYERRGELIITHEKVASKELRIKFSCE